MIEAARQQYEAIFSCEEETLRTEDPKVIAFDKIAERFFCGNFGTMSKTEFETLLFSVYIEQIMNQNPYNFEEYSDYTLSKNLGITQTKVSSLKIRKQLLFPYEKFDWRESFASVCNRAVYEEGKIKLQIPDKNLFIEIKHAIELAGGFVEIQLTPNLLQIKPEYFLDLMVALSDERERPKLRKQLVSVMQAKGKDILAEEETFSSILQDEAPKVVFQLIEACLPVFGGTVRTIGETVSKIIRLKQSKTKSKKEVGK